MTCITWDGKVLAGDKQSSVGEIPVKSTKVFRVKAKGRIYLLGIAGDETRALQFIEYFRLHGTTDYLKVKGAEVLIISKKGCWVLQQDADVSTMNEKIWALGAAGDFALGAMHAGVGAEEAVRIASKLSINSGMGVDTVKF